MKRIINGRRYDTEKAEKIGTYSHPQGLLVAGLYRKRSGEYFLHMVDSTGGTLTPMSQAAAALWAKKMLNRADFAAAFGPVPSNSPSALFVDIGKEAMACLRRGCEAEGVTLKAFVERLIREALENPNEK